MAQFFLFRDAGSMSVLDHYNNADRCQAQTSEGELRYKTTFTKQSKTWVAKPIKMKKGLEWAHELMNDVVLVNVDEKCSTKSDLPKLPENIASIPKPSKNEIVQKMVSRLK